ncbi:unnamed protein product [Orchesella dallaii]|uniref:SCP domain-containing protein n=1 Tax=Orchesella dallaii TaxID=48710 RepID=A0ABP1PIS2_9HEXA
MQPASNTSSAGEANSKWRKESPKTSLKSLSQTAEENRNNIQLLLALPEVVNQQSMMLQKLLDEVQSSNSPSETDDSHWGNDEGLHGAAMADEIVNELVDNSQNDKIPEHVTVVLLLYPNPSILTKQVLNPMFNYAQDSLALRYWRPHFVIYESTQPKTIVEDNLVYVITLIWNLLAFDATLLKASPTDLYLHNVPQSNFEPVAQTSPQSLRKFDNSRIKRNLAGAKVDIVGITFRKQDYKKSDSCSMYEVGLKTIQDICTTKVLLQHYNFTAYIAGRDSKYTLVGIIDPKRTLSSEFIQSVFLANPVSSSNTQILRYGFYYYQYKCLLFISKEHAIDVLAILFPFDIQFAFTCVFFFACAAICLTAVLRTVRMHATGFVRPALLFLFPIKALLEQGDDPVVKLCQQSFGAGYFLIFSMFYPTSLIGNEYKGHLTSTMTSGVVPNVPGSVQSLVVNTSIPYFTTTKHAANQKLYSTLTDIVLPDFIRQTQNVEKNESSLTKFLLKLTRNVKFISEMPSDVVYNMSKGLPVKTAYEGMQQFSKKFALIDQERSLALFLSLVRKFLKRYWIMSIPMETKLFTTQPWMGMRNQFLKVFTHGLAGLVEGGIYDRWVKYGLKWQIMAMKKLMHHKLNVTIKEPQFASVILGDLESSKQAVDDSSEIVIGIGSIWPAFVVFGVLLLMSFGIFAIEHPVYNGKTTGITSFNEALPPPKSLRNSRVCIGIQIIFQEVIRKLRTFISEESNSENKSGNNSRTMSYLPILTFTVLLVVTASAKQQQKSVTPLEWGIEMSSRAYEAICWYEYQKQFPKSNRKAFNGCSTQSVQIKDQILANDASFWKQMFIDNMPNAMRNIPSEYRSNCDSLILSASSDGSENEGKTLFDQGHEYPFRAFAYCLIKTLRQRFGDEAINSVKDEQIYGEWSVTKTLLERENAYRALHGSPPLKPAKQLMERAQKWSEISAAKCDDEHISHSDPDYLLNGQPTGENLSSGYGAGKEGLKSHKGYSASNSWYEEINNYNWNGGPHRGETGHFTQSIWKNSEYVGYGYAFNPKCKGGLGKWFITARYFPAGNFPGKYEKNVLPPKH